MYDFVHALAVGTTVNLSPREKTRAPGRRRLEEDLGIIALVISVAFAAHLAEIGLWAVSLVLCDKFKLGTASPLRSKLHDIGLRGSAYDPGVAFAGAVGGNERCSFVGVWAAMVFAVIMPTINMAGLDLKTECLRCETSDALPEGRPHWRIFTWARKRPKTSTRGSISLLRY